MGNKSITSNVLWKFAERFAAQLVSFVVSIVLARVLLPEDYGAVALVLVFIEIANAFVSFGLGNALIQKNNVDELDFSSVLFFNVGFSLLIYLVLFFFAPAISSFYNNNLLTSVLRILGIRLILAAINTVQQAYVSKQMAFKKFFWSTLFGTIISGVFGIFLAYRGFGVWALVAQYLINTTVDTLILFYTVGWKPKLIYSWERVRSLFKYGWKILFEGVSNILAGQIKNLLIGKVYTNADLGHYSKAQQFPQIITTNINTSISSVLFPAMSSVQNDDDLLIQLMRRSIRVSSYLIFPMLFGLAAVAPNLVTVLLTDKWISCVPYLYIFCFISLLTIGMQPRHQALKAKGRSGVFMVEHMFSRTIEFVILLLVYRINVMAIALTGVAGGVLLTLTIMFTSKKFSGYKYFDQVKDVAGLIFMSCAMFVPVFLFGYYANLDPIVELIVQIFMGVLIYFVLSFVLKPEGFSFLSSFIKRVLKKRQ